MLFKRLFILVFLFLFAFGTFAMDFTEGGGMNFDTEDIEQPKPKKKVRKKNKKKSQKKNKVSRTPKEDEGMNFADTEESEGGMNFGDDDTQAKEQNEESANGMNFDDESGGMVFTDEDVKEEGAIKQEEMNFDLADVELTEEKKKKEIKKEDKVEIKKKVKSYVVRGIYFKLSSGTTYMLSPKIKDGKTLDEKSPLGFLTKLNFGYDVNTALSAELYTEFLYNNAQIKGESNILYSRDLNSRTIGLGVNYNVINNERTNLHLNLHGGLLIVDSSLDMTGLKFSAGALIGFEYYMLLKHFSSSLYLSGDYMTGYDTLAVSLGASLKYSF